jgi:ketosteroid isomerase-like protein
VSASERAFREFHQAQAEFYAGGDPEAVRATLHPDIVWHVPGRSAIAGDYRGIEAVLDYFGRRRELARATFRVKVRDVTSSAEHVVALADGEAELGGEAVEWRTAGVFRVVDGRIAECWLLPFDQYLFDRIWQ